MGLPSSAATMDFKKKELTNPMEETEFGGMRTAHSPIVVFGIILFGVLSSCSYSSSKMLTDDEVAVLGAQGDQGLHHWLIARFELKAIALGDHRQ